MNLKQENPMQNRFADIDNAIYERGYQIIDDFLDIESYFSLRTTAEAMHKEGLFKNAKIGHQLGANQNTSVRRDKICWLDKESNHHAIATYFAKIDELAQLLNQSLFLGLVDFETHFAIYQPGAFYKMHIDQFATTQDRRISCVYYLNEHWQNTDAGELNLYDRQDQLIETVAPLGNRFICFSSDLPHEVCKTNATRYSIAGWMKTRPL